MNYVELHIGDYETATAHLTACEDGIYGRLLRRYYSTEAALPADLKAVQRLVRARSRDEREAVQTVLDEFFQLTDEGWRHRRCDAEIARYNEKREKAQRSANARWNASARNANASANAMRTHSEGNALHTPDASHQSPDKSSGPTHTTGQAPGVGSPAGHAAAALNRAGCRVTSQNPTLIAACAEGVTTEHLLEVQKLHPDKPVGYVIATARREHAEQAKPITGGTHAPAQRRAQLGVAGRIVENIRAHHQLQRGGDDDAIEAEFRPVEG